MSTIDERYDWIYTDLDTIFDTRIVTYELIDKSFPSKLLELGYRTRTYDRFDDIVKWETYYEAYRNRDKRHLTGAKLTYMLEILRMTIVDKEQQILTAPLLMPQLLINTYPYKLKTSELKLLTNSIRDYMSMGEGLIIKYVFISLPNITGEWLVNNTVHDMFMYDGEQWISDNLESENYLRHPIPRSTLHLPAVVTAPCDEPYKALSDNLDTYAMIIKPFIKLDFMSCSYFSLMDEKDLS